MSKVLRQYGIFLLVPSFILGYSIFLRIAAGPQWLVTNEDPSYEYLQNGVRIAKGLVPQDIVHPGTPLQSLIAAVCWLFNIGRSASDVAAHVFTNPEFYLQAVFLVLSLIFYFTLIGLGVYVFRKTGDGLAAILTQLPPLGFFILQTGLWHVSTECLLISAVDLFNLYLFMHFFAKTARDEHVAAVLGGLVCGLGGAVKLSFIPLLVIPLILLSWRNKIFFILICAASFILFTLPIIPKYPYFLISVIQLITHTGHQGNGPVGFIEIHSYGSQWRDIIVTRWEYTVFLFMAMALCLWKFARKEWDRGTSFLAATVLGILLQFGAVAKHPGPHYLLAGLGLFSPLWVLFYLQGPRRKLLGRRIVFIFILAFLLVRIEQMNEHLLKVTQGTKAILSFYEHIHAKYKDFLFIGFYPSSNLQSALFLDYDYTNPFDELSRLYPTSFFFNRWTGHIMNFRGRVLADDLLAQYPRGVIFQGGDDYDFNPTPFSVRLLEKGPLESVYLLKGTTEKRGFMFYLAAARFLQAGDYVRALACENQAKALHYIP